MKHISTNLKELKSYKEHPLTTIGERKIIKTKEDIDNVENTKCWQGSREMIIHTLLRGV